MTKEMPPLSLQVAEADTRASEYLAALDKIVGLAARNRCGVRVIWYLDGDVVITATHTVKFGTIEERHQ